ERSRFEAARLAPMLPGFPADQFEDKAGREEFWEILHEQILQAFDEFARQRAAAGRDERYFTGEAVKGLRVLRLMRQRYDVVATNPPYLDSRDFNPTLKKALEAQYPEG